MSANVIMPKLGMAMKEGKVVKWHLKEGDYIEKGEVIAEVETEKINYEIEAPISGILHRIFVGEGDSAAIGSVIGVIAEEGERLDLPSMEVVHKERLGKNKEETRTEPIAEVSSKYPKRPKSRSTPLARKIAAEIGIDISKIKGTGPTGRVTRDDVLNQLPPSEESKEGKAYLSQPVIGLGSNIPLTRMREIIGERLSNSFRDIPHVYFSCEIDGGNLIKFRKRFSGFVESIAGISLSFNDIIIKAASAALEKYPQLNSSLEEKSIRIHESVNIGLAVALEDGLIVPVIRKVNEMKLSQITAARKEITDKARNKKLTLDDLSGGTFTISSLAQFNLDFFTSIINPPEAAILSVPRIKESPTVINGKIAIRHSLKIGLSVDHRIVDGTLAAKFLERLQQLLEDPYWMCSI